MSVVPTVERIPRLQGTTAFEEARQRSLQAFAASVPPHLILPKETIENPPRDVTGIPRQCGILSDEELDITENYDASALAKAIASRTLSSVEVVTAFAKRAMIAHQLTFCLTDWFMDEAVQRAQELDNHLASTGTPVGPLHGVPVSIKSHIPISGRWGDLGFMSTRKEDERDCQLVAILRKAGAVFYCKTNQPQAVMHLETTSFLGRTLNPFNIDLSAGGSSGGEAALIALRGSVIGVGSDIGGSIRGPAAFCGIYGFKPTSYLLPTNFLGAGGMPAELNVPVSTGPLCRTLRDVDLFMSVMSAAKPWIEEVRVIPMAWIGLRAQASLLPAQSFKIGLMMHDSVVMPQPPVTTALEWAKKQLESSGFQVKPFQPLHVAKIMKNIRQEFWPTAVGWTQDLLAQSGEPQHPLTEYIQQDAPTEELSTSQLFQRRNERDGIRSAFSMDWQRQDVDFILCPSFSGPACAHDTARHWNYLALWNYIDCPAIVVPTPIKAKSKAAEAAYLPGEPLSDECREVRRLWEASDFEGAPVNLQFVARRYHENELFAMLASVKEALQLP